MSVAGFVEMSVTSHMSDLACQESSEAVHERNLPHFRAAADASKKS